MHRLTSNNGHYVHKSILYLVVFVFRTWKWRKSAHFYVVRAGWQKTTIFTAKCAFFVNLPVQRKNELISVTFTFWKQKPPDTGCFCVHNGRCLRSNGALQLELFPFWQMFPHNLKNPCFWHNLGNFGSCGPKFTPNTIICKLLSEQMQEQPFVEG